MQHELPKALTKEHIEVLNDLFEWMVDPCIEFIKANCKFQLPTSYLHLMRSAMNIFSCLMDEISQKESLGLSDQVVSRFVLNNHKLLNITNNAINK